MPPSARRSTLIQQVNYSELPGSAQDICLRQRCSRPISCKLAMRCGCFLQRRCSRMSNTRALGTKRCCAPKEYVCGCKSAYVDGHIELVCFMRARGSRQWLLLWQDAYHVLMVWARLPVTWSQSGMLVLPRFNMAGLHSQRFWVSIIKSHWN
jgi:hypothetical protein